jgi:hypothetical protein
MKRALLLVLAACPSPSGNPTTLWLAPDQAETHVKLIDHEPAPY